MNPTPQKRKPYIKRIQSFNPYTPEHGQIYSSRVLAFNPGEFACDPPEVFAQVFWMRCSVEEVATRVRETSETEMDMG